MSFRIVKYKITILPIPDSSNLPIGIMKLIFELNQLTIVS